MKKISILIIILLLTSNLVISQIGRLPLSPVQKVEQKIAKTDIGIEYSRPSKRERVIFGNLVPFGKYWRTGANRNTTISFSDDVIIGNQRIKKGLYSIITKPNVEEWEFLLYEDTNNWDVPEIIDTAKIKCTYVTKVIPLKETIESLNISIGDFTNYEFDLIIKWDKSQIIVPIKLTTKELMAKLIADELNGPQAGDYYSAAVYQLESEKDYTEGLKWINQAIKIRIEPKWYDFRVKALLMIQLNDIENIEETLTKGSNLANEKKSEYGISEFQKIRKLLKK